MADFLEITRPEGGCDTELRYLVDSWILEYGCWIKYGHAPFRTREEADRYIRERTDLES